MSTSACGTTDHKIKKARRRKRHNGLRNRIVDQIERSLCVRPSPIGHLFNCPPVDELPTARFSSICEFFDFPFEELLALPQTVIEDINLRANTFQIFKDNDEWRIRFVPPADAIDCTVYIDQLPDTVTKARLMRELKKFGRVIALHMPKRLCKDYKVRYRSHRARGFAVAQFGTSESAKKLCARYEKNLPLCLRRFKFRKIIFVKEAKLRRQEIAAQMLKNGTKTSESGMNEGVKTKHTNDNKRRSSQSESVSPLKSVASETKRRRLSSNLNTSVESRANDDESSAVPKNKKRNRHQKRKRYTHRDIVGDIFIREHVCNYFHRMQVLPFRTYRQLRREYVSARRRNIRKAPPAFRNTREGTKLRDSWWNHNSDDETSDDDQLSAHSELFVERIL